MIFFYMIGAYLVGIGLTAWSLMLAVGIAHIHWWYTMPTMGFGDAYNIVFWATLPISIVSVIWQIIVLAINSH